MNPTGLVLHAYVAALALVAGLAFGAIWSLIPLVVGVLVLFAAES